MTKMNKNGLIRATQARDNARGNGFIWLISAMFLLSILFAAQTSAFEFDNVKEFSKEQGEPYGTITIKNMFGFGSTLATHILLENDASIIDARATGITILNSPSPLFSSLKFRNIRGLDDSLDYNIYLLTLENYEESHDIWGDVCRLVIDAKNGTIERCTSEKVRTEKITKQRIHEELYDGKELPAGAYTWRIDGKRRINQQVDWIAESFGVELDEWAWWNNTWGFRKDLNVTGGAGTLVNFTIYTNVTFDSDMQADFDDIRFVNGACSGSQTEELKYETDYVINSSSAGFWVKIPSLTTGTNQLCMYYNASVSSASDGVNAWDANYTIVMHFSEDNGGSFLKNSKDGNTTWMNISGAAPSDRWVSGQFGLALNLSETGMFAESRGNAYDLPAEWTSEQWVYAVGVSATGRSHFTKINSRGGSNFGMGTGQAGTQWAGCGNFNAAWNSNKDWNNIANVWYNGQCSSINGVSGSTQVFQNKTSFTTDTGGGSGGAVAQGTWGIGLFQGATLWGTSLYDEIKFSNVVRTNEWINRSYDNSNLSMFVFGAEEQNVAISVTLNTPANNSFLTTSTPLMNYSVLGIGGVTIVNSTLRIYDASNNLDFSAFNNSITGLIQANITLTTTALDDGVYRWSADGVGNGNERVVSSNRTMTIDANAPNVTISTPSGIIPYHRASTNLSVNWTATDAVGTQTCIISWNNLNSTPPCQQNTTSINMTSFSPQSLTFYANDTTGNLAVQNATWNYTIFELSRSFNVNTTELATETFSINVNYDAVRYNSISSNLIYENVSYAGTQSGSAPNLTSSRQLQINTTGGGTIFRTFYWNFLLSNATASVSINTTTSQQQISNFSIDDCATYGFVVLNYTLYDEDTRSRLLFPAANNSVELNVLIGNPTLTSYVNFSMNRSNAAANEVKICVQNQPTAIFRMDATAKYSSTSRVEEYHNIQNYTLQNSTMHQNISLYDLLTTESQEFLITFKDENFIPVSDAIIDIQRQYLSLGTFLSVEIPKTDTDGRTIGHLVLSDEVYNIYVRKDGKLLATYTNVRAFCNNQATGDCKINLNAAGSSIRPESFKNNLGVSYKPFYNQSSRTYSFIYISVDGTLKTAALNITSLTASLNQSICYASQTAASGTLSCAIPASINGTAVAKVTIDGSLLLTDTFNIQGFFKTEYAKYFLAFLLLITIPFLAVTSGAMMIILFVTGFLIAGALLLLDLGGIFGASSAFLWVLIAAGVILWKISQGRNP